MKTLKYITIFTYLFFLSSCQNETIDAEEQVIDTPGALIDESYADDLEIYNETLIVFENGSKYTIEDVLTDAILFNEYKNASSQYIDINIGTDESILYVLPQDKKSAEKMLEAIEGAIEEQNNISAKGKNDNHIDYEIFLYDGTDQKGDRLAQYRVRNTAPERPELNRLFVRDMIRKNRKRAESFNIKNRTHRNSDLYLRFSVMFTLKRDNPPYIGRSLNNSRKGNLHRKHRNRTKGIGYEIKLSN